jgi:hypothetical protein
LIRLTAEQMAHIFELRASGKSWKSVNTVYNWLSCNYLQRLYSRAKKLGMAIFRIKKGDKIYSPIEPWSGKIHKTYTNTVSVMLNNGTIKLLDRKNIKHDGSCLVISK